MQEAGSKSLPLSDSHMEPAIESSIPEERSVDIGESPYNPLHSPSREDLPPLVGAASHDESLLNNHDLDSQIKRQETELRRLRGDGNHAAREAVPLTLSAPSSHHRGHTPDVTPTSAAALDEPEGSYKSPYLNGTPPVTPPAVSTQSRGMALCKVITLAIVIVFISMLAVLFVALESELDIPVLREIRSMPEVQDFKQNHYDPLKSSVNQKMEGMFKS